MTDQLMRASISKLAAAIASVSTFLDLRKIVYSDCICSIPGLLTLFSVSKIIKTVEFLKIELKNILGKKGARSIELD